MGGSRRRNGDSESHERIKMPSHVRALQLLRSRSTTKGEYVIWCLRSRVIQFGLFIISFLSSPNDDYMTVVFALVQLPKNRNTVHR